MNLFRVLSEELWLFILLAIVLALAVPQVGLYITPYAIYFLLIVMFLTSLGIGLGDIARSLQYKKEIIFSLILVFIFSPLIAFLLSFTLERDLAIGLILYSAIPSAMANAFYMKRVGRNAALALIITALTTLAAPFVTPIIVKLLTGMYINMNPADLFISLAKVIILPFVAAEMMRRYAKKATKVLLKNSAPIGNICVFFVIFGVISAAAGQVWSLGWLAVIMAAYLGICFFMGYIIPTKERIVLGFGNGFRNGTLAMVVALEVFGPTASLVGVMATLVHNIILVPTIFFMSKGRPTAH